jgi:UDP-N-acetylglucosamine transferase subunit ALG13
VPSESGCHAAGRGEHEPAFAAHKLLGLECRCYRFTDSQTLQADMAAASLVISHAGAGSILESLALKKPLVVAVSAGFLFAVPALFAGAYARARLQL